VFDKSDQKETDGDLAEGGSDEDKE